MQIDSHPSLWQAIDLRRRDFFSWWLRELRHAARDVVRHLPGLAQHLPVLRVEGDDLTWATLNKSTEQAPRIAISQLTETPMPVELTSLVEHSGDGPKPIALQLDESFAIRRQVRVAHAAETELDGVISFEVERHTPYRAHEVISVYSIDPKAADETSMAVDILIVPMAALNELIETLRNIGLLAEIISLRNGDALTELPVSRFLALPKPASLRLRGLTAAAILLSIGVVLTPLVSLGVSSDRTKIEIESLRSAASESGILRKKVTEISNLKTSISAIKASAPSMIDVLDELAKLFPDDTWLRHVTLIDGEIVIEGSSASSVRLVELLQSSPLFKTIDHIAPMTRDRPGGKERFGFSIALAGAEQ